MRIACALLLSVTLAACGHDAASSNGTTVPAATDDDTPSGTLPTPEASPGSAVTGMPTQPPPPPSAEAVAAAAAAAATPPAAPADAATDTDALPAPVDAAAAADTSTPPVATPAPDPNAPSPAPAPVSSADANAAAAVINQYMAALGANAPARAQGLWSTTPNDSAVLQLARGTTFNVGVGAPAADAGGHVTVPVDVRGKADDGSDRHVQVTYTLQRTQGGPWRILAANVHDAAP